jgi:hypothetical protein
MNQTNSIEQWLVAYGERIGTPLTLEQGICVLLNGEQQEAAVIEAPSGSDVLLLHCQLMVIDEQHSARYLRTMLALNFETDAMRGCWLALDENEALRLCYQSSFEDMNLSTFIAQLEGFMQQVDQVRQFLVEVAQQAA